MTTGSASGRTNTITDEGTAVTSASSGSRDGRFSPTAEAQTGSGTRGTHQSPEQDRPDEKPTTASTAQKTPSTARSRPKRPVDVFFDGAPRGRTAPHGPEEPANSSDSSESTPKQAKNGRSRRLSAEMMDTALARGSGRLAGRSDNGEDDAPARTTDSAATRSAAATSPAATVDEDSAPSSTRSTEDGSEEVGTPLGREASGDGQPAVESALDESSAVSSTEADEASVSGSTVQVSRETFIEVPGARFAEIAVDAIAPNARQPRSVFDEDDMAELVHSIREIGVLQPIVVRSTDTSTYELVMGERRWRAAQQAGLETIPAIIRWTDDTEMLRDALLENLHRSQLNPLEEAAAYQQLLDDFQATHDELASRIGRSRPQISNTLRLLHLPALVQRRVAAGVLTAGHARALLGLADAGEIERLAQRIVAEGLSVRATEEAVALSDGMKRSTRQSSPQRNSARHERLDNLATSLSDYLDTSVKVSLGARKGKVSIEFGSVEDLNRIIDLISPNVRQ